MIFNTICVLGLGYIGLPTASTFATHGLKVIGVDINPQVIISLKNGDVHIQEPGLRTVVQAAFRSGNLVVRQEPEPSDAFIIAVPTPFRDSKLADLGFVKTASQSIVPHLRPGCLVMLESTSPPRTTQDVVAPILETSGLKAGKDFYLAYTPERVLPGQILKELIENARVIGGVNPESAEAGRDLYSTFVRGEIILTDATTAEFIKLMENTYRDINIAAANEFSRLADRFQVDVWEAIQIANRHPRVKILNPGPGVGGHCISVDPWFLVEAAPDLASLIRTARQVNDTQPLFVLDLVKRALGNDLRNRIITVLGLSYKADVDDIRESPGIEVAHLLAQAGSLPIVYEPYKPGTPINGIQVAATLEEAVKSADALLLMVSHSIFRQLNPFELAASTSARIVIDTVNAWNSKSWQDAGFRVLRLGGNKPSIQ